MNPNTTRCDIPTLKRAVDNMRHRMNQGDRGEIDNILLAASLTPFDAAADLLLGAIRLLDDDQMISFLDRIQRTTANYPQ